MRTSVWSVVVVLAVLVTAACGTDDEAHVVGQVGARGTTSASARVRVEAEPAAGSSSSSSSSSSAASGTGDLDPRIHSLRTRVEALESGHAKLLQGVSSDAAAAGAAAASQQEQQYANVDTGVPLDTYSGSPSGGQTTQDLSALESKNDDKQQLLQNALLAEQRADAVAAQKEEALRKYNEHKQEEMTHSTLATSAEAQRDEASGAATAAEHQYEQSVVDEPTRIHKDGEQVQKAAEDIIDYQNKGEQAEYTHHIEDAKAQELANQEAEFKTKAENEAEQLANWEKNWEADEHKLHDLKAQLGEETSNIKAAEVQEKTADQQANDAVQDLYHWGDEEQKAENGLHGVKNDMENEQLSMQNWQNKMNQYEQEAENWGDHANENRHHEEKWMHEADLEKDKFLDAKNDETAAEADKKLAQFRHDKWEHDMEPKKFEMEHAEHKIGQEEQEKVKLQQDIQAEDHRIEVADEKIRELNQKENEGKNQVEDDESERKEGEDTLTNLSNEESHYRNALHDTDEKLKEWEALLSTDQQDLQSLLTEEHERKVKEETLRRSVTSTSKQENALAASAADAEEKMMQDTKKAQTASVDEKQKDMSKSVLASMEAQEKQQQLEDIKATNDGAADQRQEEFAALQDTANSVEEAQAKVDKDQRMVNNLKDKETQLQAADEREKTKKAEKKSFLGKLWDGISRLKNKVVDWARKKLGFENEKREAMTEKSKDEKRKDLVEADLHHLKEELVNDQQFVHNAEGQISTEKQRISEAEAKRDSEEALKNKAKSEADQATEKTEHWKSEADQASDKEAHFEKAKGKAEAEEAAAREQLKGAEMKKADLEHKEHEAEHKEEVARQQENEAKKEEVEARANKEHAENKKNTIEGEIGELEQKTADEKFHIDNLKDQQNRDQSRFQNVQSEKTGAENTALDAGLTHDNMQANVDNAEKDLRHAQEDHAKIGQERPQLKSEEAMNEQIASAADEDEKTHAEKAAHHKRLAEREKAKADRLAVTEEELRRQARAWRDQMNQ